MTRTIQKKNFMTNFFLLEIICFYDFFFFYSWQSKNINLGHPEETFRIILEIGSTPPGESFVAVDNIKLEHCFPGRDLY